MLMKSRATYFFLEVDLSQGLHIIVQGLNYKLRYELSIILIKWLQNWSTFFKIAICGQPARV
jgi:hypothetical protein